MVPLFATQVIIIILITIITITMTMTITITITTTIIIVIVIIIATQVALPPGQAGVAADRERRAGGRLMYV